MRAPRNTEGDGAGMLAEAMITGRSEGLIEKQEAQGQRSFVASDTLPTKIFGDGRAELEAAGVEFIGPVEGDRMFQYVKLPAGWKKEPTDHSMWSKLVDDQGRERGAIFYKAAFYDRSAHMSVTTPEETPPA